MLFYVHMSFSILIYVILCTYVILYIDMLFYVHMSFSILIYVILCIYVIFYTGLLASNIEPDDGLCIGRNM